MPSLEAQRNGWQAYVDAARNPLAVAKLLSGYVVTDSGCFEWQGCVAGSGYGRIRVGHRVLYTHRLSLLVAAGNFDCDLAVDHLCRNRRCMNPEHLEPVTHAENVRRGESSTRRVGPCIRGHDDWVKYPSSQGRGVCRTCQRDRKRATRAGVVVA